jgi:hypothetical protein
MRSSPTWDAGILTGGNGWPTQELAILRLPFRRAATCSAPSLDTNAFSAAHRLSQSCGSKPPKVRPPGARYIYGRVTARATASGPATQACRPVSLGESPMDLPPVRHVPVSGYGRINPRLLVIHVAQEPSPGKRALSRSFITLLR